MLSRIEILEEYTKCITDPKYAIQSFLKTFDKTQEGFVPFILFPRQKEIIDCYEKNRYNLVSKPRQAGVSTTTAAYLAVKVSFADINNPEKVLILANKQIMAQEFLGKVKEFLMQIPRWVWGDEYYGTPEKEKKTIFLTDSKGHLKLPNKCEVKAVATSRDALRGFTPTRLVMDEAAFIDNGAEVFNTAQTSLGTGGRCTLISCVTDDTYIFTDKGIKQVKDFIDNGNDVGGYYIPEYNVLGRDKVRSGNLFHNNGYVDTIRIDTVNASLEGSKNHKLYAYKSGEKKYGWYKLEELTTDDMVSVQYGMEIWGNNNECGYINKLTSDIAYLIGVIITKGSISKKSINGEYDSKVININYNHDISNILNSIGLKFCNFNNLTYTIWDNDFIDLLENLGLKIYNNNNKGIIPNRLLEMSKENMVSMIQGIFDTDGFSKCDNGTISLRLNSKELTDQVTIILNNIGVLTKRSNRYKLSLDAWSSEIFYNKIGFRDYNKQKNIVKLKLKRYDINDYIPNSDDIIKELIESGIDVTRYLGKKIKTSNINRFKLIKILNEINCKDYDVVSDNLRWVKIKNISYSKNYTYDFSLPETDDKWCHSVIYNGILGHQTPNGLDELYYKTYSMAKIGKNDFNIIEMKWYEDSRYNKDLRWFKPVNDDIEFIDELDFTFDSYEAKIKDGYKPTSSWYEAMCRSMNNNARMIAQELDVSFLGSGGNVINDEYIKYHEDHYVCEPKFVDGIEKETWIWEKPVEGHEYILGCDVARGDGEDSSTIIVVDVTTMEQVMEYKGKVQPDLLAEIVYEYGNLYKALTVIDIAGGMGITTVLRLTDMGYKYMHYDDPKSKLLMNKKQMSKLIGKEGDKIPGFNASSCRISMIANLERCIRENVIKIRSIRLTGEFKTFVYKNGRADHMTGFHDDLIMSLAMALFVLEHSFKNLKKLENQSKAILDSWMVNTGTRKEDKLPDNVFLPIMPKNNINSGAHLWLFSDMKRI